MLLNTLYFLTSQSLALLLKDLRNLIQLPEEDLKCKKSSHLVFRLFEDIHPTKDQYPNYINSLSCLKLIEYYLNNWLTVCSHFSYATNCNFHFYAEEFLLHPIFFLAHIEIHSQHSLFCLEFILM